MFLNYWIVDMEGFREQHSGSIHTPASRWIARHATQKRLNVSVVQDRNTQKCYAEMKSYLLCLDAEQFRNLSKDRAARNRSSPAGWAGIGARAKSASHCRGRERRAGTNSTEPILLAPLAISGELMFMPQRTFLLPLAAL
jgi:hypothetical protein